VRDSKPTVSDIDKAPETLPVVVEQPVAPSPLDELRGRFEIVADDNFRLKTENAALNQRLKTKGEIDRLLRPYANRVFGFLCAYGFVATVLLILNGFHWHGFTLSDSVLNVVVGSTAVSAIGLVGLVVNGLFGAANKAS
jgi:hypothetical protein